MQILEIRSLSKEDSAKYEFPQKATLKDALFSIKTIGAFIISRPGW